MKEDQKYIYYACGESVDRIEMLPQTELVKDKTGVKLDGVRAINPVNNTEIPIFVSDYVLMSYGTGAIMAVPAHDDRDWAFAKKFDLPIIEVVKGGNVEEAAFTDCATGIMVNSGFLDGMTVEEAKKAITEFLTEKGVGHAKVNYKLRDSPASATGANRFRWSSVRSAAGFRFRSPSCRWSCRMSIPMSRPMTANPRSHP